jgi:hypothetical protein
MLINEHDQAVGTDLDYVRDVFISQIPLTII